MSYYKYCGLELSNGNTKIGEDTLILNMGSATECPSLKLGFCKLGNKCYARRPEVFRPGRLPYRQRQAAYWQNTSADDMITHFVNVFLKHPALKKRVKYLRINEAGDFYGQECVSKLNKLAAYLKIMYGIQTYTYTARKDLDFAGVAFTVKGSGHDSCPDGKTIARPKSKLAGNKYSEKGREYVVCPADCRKCTACKLNNGLNIVFALH